MKTIVTAIAATMLVSAVPARSEILATGSVADNFVSNSHAVDVPVPINGTYNSIQFKTSSPGQIVRVTYNAECGALGSSGTWVAVRIYVDGVQAAPASGNSFAFCSATSTSYYSWTGAVRQSTIKVPNSGTHKVTVTAYGAGTTTLWLGDSSIVVDR